MAPWLGPMVTFMLGGGVAVPFDELGETDPDHSPGIPYFHPRIDVTWEPEPLEYGEPRSSRKRGAFVPELSIGTLVNGDGFDVHVGGGVKLQLDFASYRMGWLGLSMKAGSYVALRGAVMADADFTPLGEIAFGTHYWWNTQRFSFEASFGSIGREGDPELSAMLALGYGWAP